MAQKEGTQAQVILTIGAISGFVVIVLAIGLQAWFMSEEQSELKTKYGEAVNLQLVELREKQQANLNTYRWIDKDKQIAAIPIEQAMRDMVQSKGRLPSTQPK